jgi:ribA/ribD-fused uncharacterized protein
MNPSVTHQQSPQDIREKITIKYLPISVSNQELHKLFEQKGIKLATDIKYAQARDSQGKLTAYKTEDRYCYALAPIQPLLPRSVKVVGLRCKLFHAGQFNTSCKACNEVGHRAGNLVCPAKNNNDNVTAFRGHTFVLSNFYRCRLNAFGKTFHGVEYAYQWKKANDCGSHEVADQIIDAPHAGEAKNRSKLIPTELSQAWEHKSENTMIHLIQLKVKQCPEFQQALLDSKQFIAEATPDLFWGTGLNAELSMQTLPRYWPGRNMLGKIMMSVRQQLIDNADTSTDKVEPLDDGTVSNAQVDATNQPDTAPSSKSGTPNPPNEMSPDASGAISTPEPQMGDTATVPARDPTPIMPHVADTTDTPNAAINAPCQRRRGRPRNRSSAHVRTESMPPTNKLSPRRGSITNFLTSTHRSRTPKRKPSASPTGARASPRPKISQSADTGTLSTHTGS